MRTNNNHISRRSFISKSGVVLTGLTIVPNIAVSGLGHQSPSDKLNIAGIGIAGKGSSDINAVAGTENIVALCDVDWLYAKKMFDSYPSARRYSDWRKMFDEMNNSIDAVIIATPDHSHAVISAEAIMMGKHVYCEKPLTHTVYESRLLTHLAAKYKVATQMGNQGASDEGVNLMTEWVRNGEIGEVRKVEAFTDRPLWPQGLTLPGKGEWVPDTLNWDMFIGPAEMKPYNSIYHPWNWRGWWDFGTGALGDMACHILHPVFKALRLQYPTKVQGSSTLLLSDSAPVAQKVKLVYPMRPAPRGFKVKLPEVEVIWYDGGIQPDRPQGWPSGKDMNNGGGGVVFHGSKDTLICGCYGRDPWLISGKIPDSPKTERRVESSHGMDWVRASKESSENRIPCKSDFSEAGPFNEMVVMGVLAVRLQGLFKELAWNGQKMEFMNINDDETIKLCTQNIASVREDGRQVYNKQYTEPINAKQFASKMIKHTYRPGWYLPDMTI